MTIDQPRRAVAVTVANHEIYDVYPKPSQYVRTGVNDHRESATTRKEKGKRKRKRKRRRGNRKDKGAKHFSDVMRSTNESFKRDRATTF
jgi:hypothetical protein